MGSRVEHEPLSVVPWGVVSDSESVLVVTNVLVSEQGSLVLHLGFDLELNSVLEWVLLWKLDTDGVNSPSLGGVVLVPPPDNWVVVVVSPVLGGDDDVTPVLDVLGGVEEGSLVDTVSPWSSDDGSLSNESLGSDLSRDGVVSQFLGSDGSGSSVEHPPLLPSPWSVVPDVEWVLAVSDVSASVQVQSSVSTHLRSELETSSISDWWVLVLDNDLVVGDLHN